MPALSPDGSARCLFFLLWRWSRVPTRIIPFVLSLFATSLSSSSSYPELPNIGHVLRSPFIIIEYIVRFFFLCLWCVHYICRSEGIASYSMPQGDQRGAGWQFYDATYDGIWDGSLLRQGLGQLIDGKLGPDNFKASYYDQDRGELIRLYTPSFAQCIN